MRVMSSASRTERDFLIERGGDLGLFSIAARSASRALSWSIFWASCWYCVLMVCCCSRMLCQRRLVTEGADECDIHDAKERERDEVVRTSLLRWT